MTNEIIVPSEQTGRHIALGFFAMPHELTFEDLMFYPELLLLYDAFIVDETELNWVLNERFREDNPLLMMHTDFWTLLKEKKLVKTKKFDALFSRGERYLIQLNALEDLYQSKERRQLRQLRSMVLKLQNQQEIESMLEWLSYDPPSLNIGDCEYDLLDLLHMYVLIHLVEKAKKPFIYFDDTYFRTFFEWKFRKRYSSGHLKTHRIFETVLQFYIPCFRKDRLFKRFGNLCSESWKLAGEQERRYKELGSKYLSLGSDTDDAVLRRIDEKLFNLQMKCDKLVKKIQAKIQPQIDYILETRKDSLFYSLRRFTKKLEVEMNKSFDDPTLFLQTKAKLKGRIVEIEEMIFEEFSVFDNFRRLDAVLSSKLSLASDLIGILPRGVETVARLGKKLAITKILDKARKEKPSFLEKYPEYQWYFYLENLKKGYPRSHVKKALELMKEI